MAEPTTGIAVYLLPGMSIKIRSPINVRSGFGWFAAESAPVNFFNDMPKASSQLTRGYAMENTDVGELVEAPDEEGAVVVYTHKKAAKNSIWFFTRTGERALVNVITVPIHDHSSIVQGGPAYGTYYDDSEGTT